MQPNPIDSQVYPRRRTIGFLACDVTAEIDRTVWRGVAEGAQENDLNLIFFAGGALHDPVAYRRQRNRIYQHIRSNRLDGLILMSSSINFSATHQEMVEFIEQFKDVPVVSLEEVYPGIPSLLKDDYGGMKMILDHLIKTHRCRKIVFMQGPHGFAGAQKRFQAYQDMLFSLQIPFDPNLVTMTPETWFYDEAVGLFERFLDEHGLEPRYDFDAVVGVNDENALAAIQVLRKRGLRVPDDIAVTGFDDLAMAGSFSPALTTIRPPFKLLGEHAVELLLAIIDGKIDNKVVEVPGDLVIRHSCGCLLPIILEAAVPEKAEIEGFAENQSLAQLIAPRRRVITSAITERISPSPHVTRWTKQVINGFVSELDHETPGVFLAALDQVLNQVIAKGGRVKEWQRALSVLREQVAPHLTSVSKKAVSDDLLHQGRILVGEISWRHQSWKRLQSEELSHRLRMLGAQMAAELEMEGLLQILIKELPDLGIPQAFLVLYDNTRDSADDGNLILAYDINDQSMNFTGNHKFSTSEILPENWWEKLNVFNLIMEALSIQDEALGYFLVETAGWEQKRDDEIFDALQLQISGAIKAAMLHQDVKSARKEAEAGWRLAEERRNDAEEANALKSRFLSMVSHELRTPLNVISGLSENLILDFPIIFSNLAEDQKQFYRDLERIQASAQHLDNLIRDVLDLASSQLGQLRLSCEDLDILEALQPVIEIGERLAIEKGLSWAVDVPQNLPPVNCDRTRLCQVVLNLLTNAVKFTDNGKIELKITQEPGNQKMVVISVSDTGLGIPKEEQESIFEEFIRSKRATTRGYGGMGLGLAVCRRLVEMGGGRIGVESSGEIGGGSRFFFCLPAKSAASPQTIEMIKPVVLVLGSYENQPDPMISHLRDKGFEVQALAIGPQEGWMEEIIQTMPGAIVLDFSPGSQDIVYILEKIKNHPLTSDIPILIYSLLSEQNMGSMMEMNFVEKPLSTQKLIATLETQGFGNDEVSKRILIVDDEKNILDLHTRMITSQYPQIQVITAENGWQALKSVRHETPDLILLDLMMPEMDGLQLLKEMRQLDTARSIPVVVMTSQKLTHEIMTELSQGVSAVLEKGLFSSEETLNQLEAALNRNKHLGGEARRVARKAMAFIHEHYSESISRKNLAEYVGVSQAYLSMCFHQEVGITPFTYLERYRIKNAKILLETTNSSITDVAMQVGFCDSSYFGRIFRRSEGKTPLAYRRDVKQ